MKSIQIYMYMYRCIYTYIMHIYIYTYINLAICWGRADSMQDPENHIQEKKTPTQLLLAFSQGAAGRVSQKSAVLPFGMENCSEGTHSRISTQLLSCLVRMLRAELSAQLPVALSQGATGI